MTCASLTGLRTLAAVEDELGSKRHSLHFLLTSHSLEMHFPPRGQIIPRRFQNQGGEPFPELRGHGAGDPGLLLPPSRAGFLSSRLPRCLLGRDHHRIPLSGGVHTKAGGDFVRNNIYVNADYVNKVFA